MSERKQLSRKDVLTIAKLARLAVSDAEAYALSRDLASILTYVEKLSALDVTQVPATTHAVELATLLRADEPAPSLSTDLALRDAPERLGDGFGVPKIIE